MYPDVDPLAVFSSIKFFTADPAAFFYVAERNGVLLGFMTAYASSYTFSFEVGAASDLLFVGKKYRSTRAPLLLVKKFVEWGEEIGARTTTMDLMTGIKPAEVAKFLSRFGFRETGMSMVKQNG